MAMATPSWIGESRVKGSSQSMKLFLLTFSLIGLQFCWGTEQTYASPFLLALGLSKGGMSLVWIAGPLSGLIMQPIIGLISDQSTSKWGRRRPFMVGGTCAVAVCLLVLGWAKELVAYFVEDAERRRHITIQLAIADIFVCSIRRGRYRVLDFMINIAQSTCRALVVDTLPVSQQKLGAAWVTRMAGVGHILVFGIGALDLEAVLPGVFGSTQFQKVCSIAALAMAISQLVTCWAVTERVLVSDEVENKQSFVSIVYQIYDRTVNVPRRIQAICWIQFWSWIGWFPLLFYGSVWVGEIYLRHHAPNQTGDALSKVGMVGSAALIVHSVTTFITAIVLPWLVTSPGESEKPGFTPRPPESLKGIMATLTTISKPSLLNTWTFGTLIFSISMIFAPAVKSVGFATLLMAITGVSSAIASLAAGTYIGVEVNRLGSALPTHVSGEKDLDEKSTEPRTTAHLRRSSDASHGTSSTGELSGIYLGILNIYTTIPQFVGTGISWAVFSIMEPGKSPELAKDAHTGEHHSTEGVSAVGVCLFIGALSSLVAARATRRLKED